MLNLTLNNCDPWIHLQTKLHLARHLAALLLTQLSHIFPDGGHIWNPEYNFKMSITKPGPELAFIEVHSWEMFLTQVCAWLNTLDSSGKHGGNSLTNCAVLSAFPCASLNLVFCSLLHCKSISSIWNKFGTLSTSAEKGSANSCKVSQCALKSANS